MGIFKKIGSFLSGSTGTARTGTGKQSAHHTIAKKKGSSPTPIKDAGFLTTEDLKRSIGKAVGETKRRIGEDVQRVFGDTGGKNAPKSESLYDTYRDELAREAREDWERKKRYLEQEQQNLDPQSRFLFGEMVTVVSSNVEWIQFDRWRELLYIGYKNSAVYVYYSVDAHEAISMFTASSHGKWVWDTLRVRGTVWGYKKNYSFLEYSLGGYQPRYMDESGWTAEHAAIPPNGEPPAGWKVSGEGPYANLPWYNKSPGPESDKHQLPMAKIFEEPDDFTMKTKVS